MVEVAHLALGIHPFHNRKIPNVGVIISGQGFKTGIEKVIVPKLKEVVGTKDLKKVICNNTGTPVKAIWRNGSVTHFMSAEQDDKVFEGMTVDYMCVDEPVRREIFIAMKRGLMKTNGICWFACTPLDEVWMYEELYIPGKHKRDPDIHVFEGTPEENPYLSDKAKQEFKKRLTKEEVMTRWYGQAMHLSVRVFKEYNFNDHRIPFFDVPEHWPVWVGIDPHKNKPHMAIFLAVSPSGVKYVVNEVYLKCWIHDFTKKVLEVGEQYNVISRVIDPSAQEMNWGREISARGIMASLGCETKLAYKSGQKANSIILINHLLEGKELFITDNCLRLHREFMGQVYKKSRVGLQVFEEPEKYLDDATDALRYILIERPTFAGKNRIKDHGSLFGAIGKREVVTEDL